MKVKDLVGKAHLIAGQKTTIRDTGRAKTFVTQGRYDLCLDSGEVERIMRLKVNSFEASAEGLTIWAQ